MLKTVEPAEVRMGMYIESFEGSWISHPFWRSHFVVDRDDVLAKVRASGVKVVINTGKGADVSSAAEWVGQGDAGVHARRRGIVACTAQPRSAITPLPSTSVPNKRPLRVIAPAAFGRADRTRAVALAERSTKAVKALFQDCLHDRAITAPVVLAVVDDIAATLEQNVAAFLSVTRLKAKDDETYAHSVAVCALMISLAREAGVTGQSLRDIGTAGLLHDIGKLFIPDAVLKKEGDLTDDERREIRRHPELGHALLETQSDLPPIARDVCLHHHERLNGSGYPFGLSGETISQASRIAAICDVFDAMTSDRPYHKGLTPMDALSRMQADEDVFDPQLLFRFMRSIGIFVPGMLVRLRSNRLAVTLPSDKEHRLPTARIFYSTRDTCFLPLEDVVLSDKLNADQAISAEDPQSWFMKDWHAITMQIVAGKAF